MKCQTFENSVIDLARNQVMDAGIRDQALAHAAGCEACTQKLEQERMLSLRLNALRAEMKSVKAASWLEDELVTAYRHRGVRLRSSSPAKRHGYFVAAVAALFLIVFGMVIIRFRSLALNGILVAIPEISTKSPGPIIDARTGVMPLQPESAPPKRVARKIPRTVRPHSRSGPENVTMTASTEATDRTTLQSEVATQFMPLGYVSPFTLQDGGQLVRIELSRSAMVSLGVPVNMDRFDERVKADVLVGADGLARAIRFVQ